MYPGATVDLVKLIDVPPRPIEDQGGAKQAQSPARGDCYQGWCDGIKYLVYSFQCDTAPYQLLKHRW